MGRQTYLTSAWRDVERVGGGVARRRSRQTEAGVGLDSSGGAMEGRLPSAKRSRHGPAALLGATASRAPALDTCPRMGYTRLRCGPVAHSGERGIRIAEVRGSNPLRSTTLFACSRTCTTQVPLQTECCNRGLLCALYIRQQAFPAHLALTERRRRIILCVPWRCGVVRTELSVDQARLQVAEKGLLQQAPAVHGQLRLVGWSLRSRDGPGPTGPGNCRALSDKRHSRRFRYV